MAGAEVARAGGRSDIGAMVERILVIKLGAFGDLIQAFDSFQAIRRHHPQAEITLMTALPFAGLATAMPWFDRVWTDARPGLLRPDLWLGLRMRFLREGFARVYDLQCSRRTARYFAMLPRRARPQWVGAARGASHPNPDFSGGGFSNRDKMQAQLLGAGLAPSAPAELDWLATPITDLGLPARFALLIPGCSPHRLYKRWPAERYGALAAHLAERGFASVLVGTEADREAVARARAVYPAAIDLCGRTSLFALASVARLASFAVGNDTGATFLASALDTPTLMLMSGRSDKVAYALWGRGAEVLQTESLLDLSLQAVVDALRPRLLPSA